MMMTVLAGAGALVLAGTSAAVKADGPPDEVTKWEFQPCFDQSDAGWASGVIPWAEAVEEATEGTVQIDVRPAGSLTSGSEAFGAAVSGLTDGVACWATVYGGDMPEGMLVFGLPMGATSPEEAWDVMWGEKYMVGELVEQAADQRNLLLVLWTDQALNDWAEAIADWQDSGRDVYVYFNNTAGEGHAPHDAQRLRDRLGEQE
jgi:TRAP-type C4-dicarboxylate transport system substrate-binding protein